MGSQPIDRLFDPETEAYSTGEDDDPRPVRCRAAGTPCVYVRACCGTDSSSHEEWCRVPTTERICEAH